MPKIETKKLLVEGAEELRVIPQLMEANGVTWNRGEEPLNIINLDFPRINILAMAKSLTEPELKQYNTTELLDTKS
jgi:hypothetical protein